MKTVTFRPSVFRSLFRLILPILALCAAVGCGIAAAQGLAASGILPNYTVRCMVCVLIAIISALQAIPRITYRLTETELQKSREWSVPLSEIKAIDVRNGLFSKSVAIFLKTAPDTPLTVLQRDLDVSAARFAELLTERIAK